MGIFLLICVVGFAVITWRCYRAGMGAPITYLVGVVGGVLALLAMPPRPGWAAPVVAWVWAVWVLGAPGIWLALRGGRGRG
jgi:hypothetical protein